MRGTTLAYPALFSVFFGLACGSADAPDCFLRENGKCVIPEYGPPPAELSIDCGMPPKGAVGANYVYDIKYSGPDTVVFDASGLPDGLTIGATTGQLYGNPTMAGVYDMATVTIIDSDTGSELSAECPAIEIGERLSHDLFDLPASAPLGCLPVGEALADHMCGGDDSEITCSADGAMAEEEGEGVIPDGVSFDAASCSASGSPSEDRYGTWVWMVEVQQSGLTMYVPFCATNDAATFHDLAVTDGGQDHDPLAPILAPFDPEAELEVGVGDTLRFDVTAACNGGSCNNWGYKFNVDVSPFDAWNVGTDGANKNGNQLIGFYHHMWATTDGKSVNEKGFGDRAWVANWRMWYCTSTDLADCDFNDDNAIYDNAQTRYVWSVVAYPQP